MTSPLDLLPITVPVPDDAQQGDRRTRDVIAKTTGARSAAASASSASSAPTARARAPQPFSISSPSLTASAGIATTPIIATCATTTSTLRPAQ